MRLSERMAEWPVEEWAAAAARLVRRVRRRAARRRGALAGLALGGVLVAVVASNALWHQTATHPAPLWGAGSEGEAHDIAVAAHGAATESPAPDEGPASDLVAKVQSGLAEAGFFSGEAKGILDEKTREAIREFERAQGLPMTGEPSVALLAAVSSGVRAVTPPPAEEVVAVRTLPVAEMQRLLNEKGFGPLTVDGLMGPNTRAALRRFAEARGIATSDPRSPAVMRALAEDGV